MLKYAFIANSENMTPEDYHWEYDNDEMKFRFYATNNMDATKKCAQKLADEGFEYLDLCGDFDAAKAKEVENAAMGRISVAYAKYSKDEEEKFESLQKMDDYGLIVMAPGLEPGAVKIKKMPSPEFNTTIALVGDDEASIAAARDFASDGIDFIELCGYFDDTKTKNIIRAIDGKTPVGSCG